MASYSPIDESSYSDSNSFDPEAMLNPRPPREYGTTQRDVANENNYIPNGAQQPYQPQAGVDASTSQDYQTADNVNPDMSSQTSRPTLLSRLATAVSNWQIFKFLGIVLIFFAAYTFIVCCSYFFTVGTDQSAVLFGETDPQMYENAGHKFGATLAHALIDDWLGVGAFVLIFYLGACGLSMIGIYRPGFWNMTVRCLLSAIAISVIAGLLTCEVATPIYWGGMHGQVLNERLIAYTGIWGALFISLLLGVVMIMLYIRELRRVYNNFGQGFAAFRTRNAERMARREVLRAEARAKAEVNAETLAECERLRAECDRLRAAVEAAKYTPQPVAQPDVMQPVAAAPLSAQPEAVCPEPIPTQVAEVVVEKQTVKNQVKSDSLFPSQVVNEPVVESAKAVDTARAATVETVEMPLDENDEAEVTDIPEESEAAAVTDSSDDEDVIAPLFPNAAQSQAITSDSNKSDEIEDSEVDEVKEEEIAPLFADSRVKAPEVERDPNAVDPRDRPLYDPRADLSNFRFPTLDLLNDVETRQSVDEAEMDENIAEITKTLSEYRIAISNIKATVGPTVTLYEIVPAEGVRIARIKNLEDDIALKLAALGIRIIAPIPGRGTVGIEVPNKDPQTVSMRSVFASETFRNTKMDLPMAIGRTVSNDVFMADLAKMPHLLVAGATGMGKSVGLNAIIASLLYKKHPSELKFVMIDPKQVEFSLYAKLERHYLAKLPDEEDAIITDPSKVIATLNSLCVEMDNRYSLLKDAQMRNIKEYNERFVTHALNPERGHRYLPYIVVVVDEFADLIMTAGKEVETPIARIAQKARAVGIHMILATQRPSTNVITGVIKANFPGRIAFRVFQMVDSRTIIDRPGANQLIGRGDMLFSNNGKIERVQCAFIDTPEVTAICDYIDNQVGYPHAYDLPEYVPESGDVSGSVASLGDRDPLFDECARLVVQADNASTSSLQRRYSIGYNRAGKIMDQMEAAGIVGPAQGGKPRSVLVDSLTLERILENK